MPHQRVYIHHQLPLLGWDSERNLKAEQCLLHVVGVHKVWIVALVLFICAFCLHCFTVSLFQRDYANQIMDQHFCAELNIWTHTNIMFSSNIWSTFDELLQLWSIENVQTSHLNKKWFTAAFCALKYCGYFLCQTNSATFCEYESNDFLISWNFSKLSFFLNLNWMSQLIF